MVPPAPLWHAYDQYRVARSGMASQRHDHVSRAKIHEAISRNFDWPQGNFFTHLIKILENLSNIVQTSLNLSKLFQTYLTNKLVQIDLNLSQLGKTCLKFV